MAQVDAPRTEPLIRATALGHVDVPASGVGFWRQVWSRRHTVAAIVAAGLLFLLLVSARGSAGGLELALLAVAATVGALTLATYVPPAGVATRAHLSGGACAVLPVVATLGAPVLLSQAAAGLAPVLVLLACYALAAGKRITDHATC
ncbi:hypothetical protein FOJ82_05050 [Tessaracoccus rhinocerotis]|uniref:Uncharacterized protein n=1 Tax=Tessaracoccus rhinocerotis TaxID=1689449 RepID=A0A553K6C8_9ACTN|nr:hypothetical protein [Tessaracoccus rhinocerotis]TRY20231.1 hypothetical protein FOJ82_05050 [Tessaracoccus rhinocerotis]